MDDAGFREYIGARLDPLRRTAYLMCGDWHTADDVVSSVVLKLYQGWNRIARMENLDAYARRAVVNAWLDERRRPWRRERPVPASDLPTGGAIAGDPGIHDRLAILRHLNALPARRRAVIVLRYYCDLSVEDTAEVLGCSPGTVKSQAARALDTLRGSMVDLREG
jgi:RNA polymerase sigma-70 factor (sigma-E family)